MGNLTYSESPGKNTFTIHFNIDKNGRIRLSIGSEKRVVWSLQIMPYTVKIMKNPEASYLPKETFQRNLCFRSNSQLSQYSVLFGRSGERFHIRIKLSSCMKLQSTDAPKPLLPIAKFRCVHIHFFDVIKDLF